MLLACLRILAGGEGANRSCDCDGYRSDTLADRNKTKRNTYFVDLKSLRTCPPPEEDVIRFPIDQMGLDDIKLDEFEFLEPGPREHAVVVNA